MIRLENYNVDDVLYFKFAGGVKLGKVKRINKKTITVDFGNDYYDNDKLTVDGKEMTEYGYRIDE